jgi:hypothetical protein
MSDSSHDRRRPPELGPSPRSELEEQRSALVADEVALAALLARTAAEHEALVCDGCDAPIEGDAAHRGLLLWARGDEVRVEEPALCEDCALAVGRKVVRALDDDDDGSD